MCTISAPPHETKPARLSQSSARGGAAQRPAAEVRTPLQAPLSARPPAAPSAPHLTPLPFQGPLSVPRAAASVVLTGVFLQQPLLSTPKVHLWVVLWEPRHAEVPVCSAPGLCSPPAKGEWAADAEHSRSSTAEPLAARC